MARKRGTRLSPPVLERLSDRELALDLEPWHDGRHIYAVTSCLYAGHQPARESVVKAIVALRRLKQDANHPEAVSDQDVRDNNALADELVRRFRVSPEELP